MNKAYFIRHAESVGNQEGIIQGTSDYPLSENGIDSLNNLDYQRFHNVKTIYTSQLKRAQETGQIIQRHLITPKIVTDASLNEVNWGVLNDKRKDYCQEHYPYFYDIYKQRQDYNLIEGADTWEYNQARALAFLEKYLDHDDQVDLVVSHAAFLRVLINMILGRYRNTPIDVRNCAVFETNDPLKNLKFTQFDIAKSAVVHRVDCFDNTYILKRKYSLIKPSDIFEKDVLDYLNNYFATPIIQFMVDKEDYQVKISRFLNGIHKFGQLSDQDIILLTKRVKELNQALNNYQTPGNNRGNIINELNQALDNLLDEKAKSLVRRLLISEKFVNYVQNGKYVLVHNDLHRSNILFDNQEVHLLDFENIKLYPELLQLATFICSSFLLENQMDSIEQILGIWGDNVDKELIYDLIDYRLIYGLSFFDRRIKNQDYDEIDLEIRNKYIKALGGRI